jgi:hypothetical protein
MTEEAFLKAYIDAMPDYRFEIWDAPGGKWLMINGVAWHAIDLSITDGALKFQVEKVKAHVATGIPAKLW